MTNREETLDWLYRLRSNIYVYMPKEWYIPMNDALNDAIKALEQETVSKEVYDHEYFLRKEYEVKIDKLQRQLDKIRAEIVDLGQRTMNDNRASGIWACRDIIDKYKAESEN